MTSYIVSKNTPLVSKAASTWVIECQQGHVAASLIDNPSGDTSRHAHALARTLGDCAECVRQHHEAGQRYLRDQERAP